MKLMRTIVSEGTEQLDYECSQCRSTEVEERELAPPFMLSSSRVFPIGRSDFLHRSVIRSPAIPAPSTWRSRRSQRQTLRCWTSPPVSP
jgi:hypothetical protein